MQVLRELKRTDNDPWYGTGKKVGMKIHEMEGGWIDVVGSWLVIDDWGRLLNVVGFRKNDKQFGLAAFRGKKGKDYIEGSCQRVDELETMSMYLEFLKAVIGE